MKVVAALVAALCLAPASALAAAPANDDFANREVLSGSLPIEITESNLEATKEDGEYIPGLAPAGHSIWFEWEAQATEWVTIGSCGSDFATIIGVFIGTELSTLAPVASGNSAEGPHCYGAKEYTFKASSGAKYTVAVDGNAFTPSPEVPAPDTEGEVVLRIEPTPPPPNDDFAAAANLTAAGQIYEFEPGETRFYFTRLQGYNWNASKEPREPEHEGDPGGASAWYEWTAPATGLMHMSACCFADPIVGLYTGNAVDELTPVPMNAELWPEKQVQVVAGQTYMIAVDGRFLGSSGEAAQVSFGISASMRLPALPKQDEGPAALPAVFLQPTPDQVPPQTSLSKLVLKRKPPIFVFRFESSEAGSTFRCSLDNKPFKSCGSSKTFKRPIPGKHRLRVIAVDSAGNADPSPAVRRFSFPPQQRHHAR